MRTLSEWITTYLLNDMNREEIEKVVLDITEKVISPIDSKVSVSLEDNFRNDLGGDSLDMVQVVMDIEHRLDISVSDAECECLTTDGTTVKDIVDLMEKRYKEKHG